MKSGINREISNHCSWHSPCLFRILLPGIWDKHGCFHHLMDIAWCLLPSIPLQRGDSTLCRAWNFPCYIRILRHASVEECGNDMVNSKLCFCGFQAHQYLVPTDNDDLWKHATSRHAGPHKNTTGCYVFQDQLMLQGLFCLVLHPKIYSMKLRYTVFCWINMPARINTPPDFWLYLASGSQKPLNRSE